MTAEVPFIETEFKMKNICSAASCIVSVYTQAGNKKTDASTSGFMVEHGIVVTTATILAQLVVQYPDLLNNIEKSFYENRDFKLKCQVTFEKLPSRHQKKVSFNDLQTTLTRCSSDYTSTSRVQHYNAEIIHIFSCPNFTEAFERLLGGSDWSYDQKISLDEDQEDSKKNDNISGKILTTLMQKFVLLKVDDLPVEYKVIEEYINSCVNIGDKLDICATPFGNLSADVFINSWSSGIVSNVYGKDNCLILTDARMIPGTEGGPVYVNNDNGRKLCGIVVASLCWKNNEWIGLSIVCSIKDVISAMFIDRLQRIENIPPSSTTTTRTDGCLSMYNNIVMVKVGDTWGSGVIINYTPSTTYILTCSHVVKPSHSHPVSIRENGNKSFVNSHILYHHDPPVQFDIALLSTGTTGQRSSATGRTGQKSPSTGQRSISTGTTGQRSTSTSRTGQRSNHTLPVKPIEGSRVYAIGHAIFGENFNLEPTITSGIISKVIKVNNVPVMIQTTCAVHPGASGGALVNEDGRLVGVIASNTKDTESGACFPHVSMVIPAITIWSVISSFIHSQDVDILKQLHITNKTVNDLWSLKTSKPAPQIVASSKL
ncbi:peroxisomal leader peptide-processing protease isoform X2 [Patella vulgata]|uniref:peroxisomal leader peptide-processing protease isoform X2 n=1 Tax=Patella vulgata TaxID=6465 RepID=UPI00218076D7|nr:peroxisomal leader peptide-processing protease isoform X2 [Patella vulgata]